MNWHAHEGLEGGEEGRGALLAFFSFFTNKTLRDVSSNPTPNQNSHDLQSKCRERGLNSNLSQSGSDAIIITRRNGRSGRLAWEEGRRSGVEWSGIAQAQTENPSLFAYSAQHPLQFICPKFVHISHSKAAFILFA